MQTRRLSRSMIDRTFGGVCGGLGTYLSINAWWVRVAFMVFTLFTFGSSLLLYLILWLAIPQQTLQELPPGDPTGRTQVSAETLIVLGSGVVLLGIMVLGVSLGLLENAAEQDVLLPFIVIGLGLVLLAQQLRRVQS